MFIPRIFASIACSLSTALLATTLMVGCAPAEEIADDERGMEELIEVSDESKVDDYATKLDPAAPEEPERVFTVQVTRIKVSAVNAEGDAWDSPFDNANINAWEKRPDVGAVFRWSRTGSPHDVAAWPTALCMNSFDCDANALQNVGNPYDDFLWSGTALLSGIDVTVSDVDTSLFTGADDLIGKTRLRIKTLPTEPTDYQIKGFGRVQLFQVRIRPASAYED